MDTVVAKVTLKLTMKMSDSSDFQNVINELDITVLDTLGLADIEDCEVLDAEVIDSK
jgi:hypothetical protein